MAKFYQFCQRCLIYCLVAFLGIPLTLVTITAGSHRAKAAENLKDPVATKIIVKENPPGENDLVYGLPGALTTESKVEVFLDRDLTKLLFSSPANADGSFKPISLGDNFLASFYLRSSLGKERSAKITLENDIVSPAISGSIRGFSPDKTFIQGENVSLRLTLGERKLEVWAKISSLDKTFPQNLDLVYEADGIWSLKTPVLSENLNPGWQTIFVYAQDQAGNRLVEKAEVFLKQLAMPVMLKVQTDERNLIDLAWQKVAGAKQYLVEWNVQGESTIKKIKVDNIYTSTRIRNLKPGTFYEVRVSALGFSGEIGLKAETLVKTLGQASEKVAGIKTVVQEEIPSQTITPAIGSGISTQATPRSQIAVTNPKVEESPVGQVETEETPEETKEGNWSRLLVALAILVIAAGAAIGGYYGYEWYLGRDDKEPPAPKSSSRW